MDTLRQSTTNPAQLAKFMGPTLGPPGSCRPQMGPMPAPWSLLSGCVYHIGLYIFAKMPFHGINTLTWDKATCHNYQCEGQKHHGWNARSRSTIWNEWIVHSAIVHVCGQWGVLHIIPVSQRHGLLWKIHVEIHISYKYFLPCFWLDEHGQPCKFILYIKRVSYIFC